MEEDISMSKVVIKDSIYYIKCVWKTRSLFVKLFVDNECWIGELSVDLLRELSSEALESEETYFENLQKAFGVEKESFALDFIKESRERAELIWKKKYDNAVDTYGSVPLLLEPIHDKNSLIDELIGENTKLKDQVIEKTSTVENLTKELEQCKEDWEKDVKIKENIESTLYGKFVQLLNTKKKKIQELQEGL